MHNLLLPYQGSFPANEEQLQSFIQGVRRIGLLHDDSPNTLGSIIGGRHRPMFLTDADADAGADGMGGANADHTTANAGVDNSSGVFTTWSWDAEESGGGAEGGMTYNFPSSQAEMSDSSSALCSIVGSCLVCLVSTMETHAYRRSSCPCDIVHYLFTYP